MIQERQRLRDKGGTYTVRLYEWIEVLILEMLWQSPAINPHMSQTTDPGLY